MIDKELISKLHQLRSIKPREEWVVLAKKQFLQIPVHQVATKVAKKALFEGVFESLFDVFFGKALAYSIAVLLIAITGTYGVMKLPLLSGVNIAENSPGLSTTETDAIKSNVEVFKTKSKDLAKISKDDSNVFSSAVDDIKNMAKQLTEKIQKDPQLAKEVALEINNNKTYLNIQSVQTTDLKETSNDLYKTIANQMIKDLEEASLTESQEETLQIAKDLYDKERYTDSLESILLLSMAMVEN